MTQCEFLKWKTVYNSVIVIEKAVKHKKLGFILLWAAKKCNFVHYAYQTHNMEKLENSDVLAKEIYSIYRRDIKRTWFSR